MILQCPQCAALVAFEHSTSTLKVCTCGIVLKRKDNELAVDHSLNAVTLKGYYIKPGTTGVFENRSFTVLGKMGAWFEESFFSYWNIVFNDGKSGYLAEGYGLYSILLPENISGIKNVDLATNKIGQVASTTQYQLQKRNSSVYWEVEGELCLENYAANFKVYEYASEAGGLLTIFEWYNSINSYNNRPVSFDALELKNLQDSNPYGLQQKCPHCSNDIKIKTYPLAQSCACNKCDSFLTIEKKQLVKKGTNTTRAFENLLPIGTTGLLKGISYEVVGYTEKQEKNQYKSKWREYVLFNPVYGFAFLSEYDGHWLFVKETIASPVVLNDNIKAFIINSETFQLYNSYSYKILEAKGEFPYNVFDNSETQVKEYISPPEIWIREKNAKEGIVWYFGEHISRREIKKAFAVTTSMPYRIGIGAVQPTGYINIGKLITAAIMGILLLILIHQLFLSTQQNKLITEGNYVFADSSNKTKLVTEKFTLSRWRSSMAFEIDAPVSNSWFELNATLVNAETGKEYSMQKGVEYYYGYSDGENWTEGSTSETAYITNIPSGKYFLEMEGTKEINSINQLSYFKVKVIYDPETHRNFWIAVLLLLIWPVANYFINRYTEQNRWENSPYSAYNQE